MWRLITGSCVLLAVACGAGDAGDETVTQSEQALRSNGLRSNGLRSKAQPIGLSLSFTNGVAGPVTLVRGGARFLQEIDITEAVATPSDEGIDPLLEHERLSRLDWDGIEQVEEIWSPGLDGTFTRERYYRGARWMERPSHFRLRALDCRGKPLGKPWKVRVGPEDRQLPGDDMFVRRFVARQSAFGCAAVGDCSGAVYVAEALVQARGALDPEDDAQRVPPGTERLRLTWNHLPRAAFELPVQQVEPGEMALGHGFEVTLEAIAPPIRGYYLPGESVALRVAFFDGDGQRLHPEGELPTYAEFAAGEVASGLRYLDLQLQTRLYYALKHRESNLLAVLSGPTHRLRTPQGVVDPLLFFGPQVPFATRAVDGFTAVGQTVPPAGIVFGGLAAPEVWEAPVSDVLSFTLPPDAEAGTYVAAIKARRDFAGEALNRGASLEIQVGQLAPTTFTAQTTCVSCHAEERTSLATVLHGLDDRRACFGCHASLGIELDNALDIRVHAIHDRSDRFGADVGDCSSCHVTPPSGPARGLLP